jgi:hypothetical protein
MSLDALEDEVISEVMAVIYRRLDDFPTASDKARFLNSLIYFLDKHRGHYQTVSSYGGHVE